MYVDTQDSDYPLLQKLPSSEIKITQCIEFLVEIKKDIELKEKYKQACFDIQRNYDLGTFIEKNFRLVNTLLQSEEIVISLINKKIQSCDNKEEFNSILIQYKDLIKKKRLQIFG